MATIQEHLGIGGMFDWIIGGLTTVITGALTWVFHHVIVIDKRLSVLEARPVVDPIEYTKAITMMAGAVTELTKAITDLRLEFKEFREEVDQALKMVEKAS